MAKQKPALNYVGASSIEATRKRYGLSVSEAAHMCCVTVRTWKRWESGETQINPCIYQYWLSVLEQRLIPRSGAVGKRWQGWYFSDGKLYTPYGMGMTAAQIESQQEQINQTRSMYRQMHKVRDHAKSGMSEAGMNWHGWQFSAGFLISPDDRKIGPQDLYVMMVGHDAMKAASNHVPKRKERFETEVIQLEVISSKQVQHKA